MKPSTKAAPMTKDETVLLVQLVAASAIINTKATNATNNKMKVEAWQKLAVDFNSTLSSSRRTPAQLRLKWENLKKAARKRCANMRMSRNKTGGGKDYFPPDEVLDKVASLLGSTCTSFSVEFGGDATDQDVNLVMGEIENVEVTDYEEQSDGGDGTCSESGDEKLVLKDTQIFETPPPPKHKNFYLNKASGSGTLAERKEKMEDEMCKARIMRENAVTEYLLVKKRKIELENRRIVLENEEKELHIAKLKLELKRAGLEHDLN